jgi:hypothetical protein
MTIDDDQPVPDDELAALLRRVSDDLTLQPQYRDRARSAMFAEFDAIVTGAGAADSKEHLSVVPAIEFDEERRRPSRRSFVSGWSAAAAACLIVLTLALVANLRNESATSTATDPSVPSTPAALPAVEDPVRALTTESLPIVLDDATYRTDEIRNGATFGGADGLQLVALRPGLMVLDAVSDGGDLRARVSVFEAEPTSVADVIDGAVEDGDMQVSAAQFSGADQSLRRQDLTVTGEGVADLDCIAQRGCLPLVDDVDEFDPSIWARSENFLVEAIPGEPSVFVLVQTKAFGDPLLSQTFEIINSLRLD